MAISPPSDIVLDVARAAEPADIEAARAELSRRVDNATGVQFAGALSLNDGTSLDVAAKAAASPEAFKQFEAMVLQTFVQNMLPDNATAVYGKGVAGEMWKSLLAEKVSAAMAERGGIGIADRVLGDHYVHGEKKIPVGAVSGFEQSLDTDRQAMLSTALVQEMQRRLTRTLTEDQSVETSKL